jgi:hypothetical protein
VKIKIRGERVILALHEMGQGVYMGRWHGIEIEVDRGARGCPHRAHAAIGSRADETTTKGQGDGANFQAAVDAALADLCAKLSRDVTRACREFEQLDVHAIVVRRKMEAAKDAHARVEALLGGATG